MMGTKKEIGGFGARKLHPEEIKQSLPTYEKLKEQIEEVRRNAQQYKKDQHINRHNTFAHPQTINNFSILGSRGTGKSSILKTLYEYLDSDNKNPCEDGELSAQKKTEKKNILLPPIVPENLVNHISLMGCILGLLKPEVESIVEEEKRKSENKMCLPQKHFLEKEYSKLMAEYVRLQQPYEQISVQEFSTDADYVQRMTSVFEAGNQFTIRFRNFIDRLLKMHEGALLFIFIDDVDLSTNRCGDIVKTLLSYLSHPSIVTVLAGDLEVFGEALTLDFLRQEDIPDTEFIDGSYLVAASNLDEKSKTLIERKKQMAYEYLKKVMPPNNRHYILRWTLSMRGDFQPLGMKEDTADRENIPKLREVLVQSTHAFPLLTHYFSAEDSKVITQSGQKLSDFILYHIFDFTARGLISSYNAIRSIIPLHPESGDTAKYIDIKFALESIVAANYGLSNLQDIIFKDFLILSTEQETVHIRFDNFQAWIGLQLPYLKKKDTNRQAKEKMTEPDEKMEFRVFQVFIFLDWATRLLGKEQILQTPEYDDAKRIALYLVCVNGGITERSEKLDPSQRQSMYSLLWEKGKKETEKTSFTSIKIDVYFKLPFPIAIRYFQVLDIPHIIEILSKDVEESLEERIQESIRFVQVLQAFYGEGNELELSECLAQYLDLLREIRNVLNKNQRELVLSMLAQKYFQEDSVFYALYCMSGWEEEGLPGSNPQFTECFRKLVQKNKILDYIAWALPVSVRSEVEVYMKRLTCRAGDVQIEQAGDVQIVQEGVLINAVYHQWMDRTVITGPFYNEYTEHIFGRMLDEEQQVCPLKQIPYFDDFLGRQIEVIQQIDENNLWNFDQQYFSKEQEGVIGGIKKYIYDKLKNIECSMMSEYFKTSVLIKISQNAKKLFEEFCQTYTGSSLTVAEKCKIILRDCDVFSKEELTTMEYVAIRVILERLIYSSAWYGKEEAKNLLNALDQCKLNIFENLSDKDEQLQKDRKEYLFWFHCYCRYRTAEMSEEVYQLADCAHQTLQLVDMAFEKRDFELKKEYFETLSERIGIDRERLKEISTLFAAEER